jgi:hypothetical protein
MSTKRPLVQANLIMSVVLKRVWSAIVILFMPYVLAFIGVIALIQWVFRSRAERTVRAHLRATEGISSLSVFSLLLGKYPPRLRTPEGRRLITGSCLLSSEPAAWIVGIDHGFFLDGGPERRFRVDKQSRTVEELTAKRSSLCWRVLRPPPDPIPVTYQDTTDDCIPTPPEVESFAATFPGRSDPIFWKDEDADMCGLRTAAGHRAWHAATIDSMELCFQRPADGVGGIVIRLRIKDGRTDSVVLASQFTEIQLAWFRQLSQDLKELIGCDLKELDEG